MLQGLDPLRLEKTKAENDDIIGPALPNSFESRIGLIDNFYILNYV